MDVDLKRQEEELKLLLSKADSEIARFEKIYKGVEVRKEELNKAVKGAGLQSVPFEIGPHSDGSKNLDVELKNHILELNKIKNFINAKLNVVIREEELLVELQKRYGKNVGVKRLPGGEFDLTFSDAETKAAFSELQKGRKVLSAVRKTVQSLSED
ncbi:MAG: hypothetical protein QGI60_05745 [archaeon]|jgi:hypothetical protein|nr:hypothetical protein [archaeon]